MLGCSFTESHSLTTHICQLTCASKPALPKWPPWLCKGRGWLFLALRCEFGRPVSGISRRFEPSGAGETKDARHLSDMGDAVKTWAKNHGCCWDTCLPFLLIELTGSLWVEVVQYFPPVHGCCWDTFCQFLLMVVQWLKSNH